MKRRVTLKEIAYQADVHVSTVSLALRDNPRIPAETRKRIQKIAAELGYVPDATMSALSSYRNAVRPHAVQSGLAYLTDMVSSNAFGAMVYERAKRRARERGYNLIEFNLSAEPVSLERLKSIWWNTGLKGVVIGPFSEPRVLDGDWSRWPVVAYGYSIPEPNFNRAVVNHFQDMLLHLSELSRRGYQKIGLCLPKRLDTRTGGQLRAAYLLFHDDRNESPRRILNGRDADDPKRLSQWVEEEQLDVVIAYHEHYLSLVASGWSIPEQIGFSLLTKRAYESETRSIAGLNTKAEVLAQHTIDFIISLIHEQAYGILESPRVYMISGEYDDGDTIGVRT